MPSGPPPPPSLLRGPSVCFQYIFAGASLFLANKPYFWHFLHNDSQQRVDLDSEPTHSFLPSFSNVDILNKTIPISKSEHSLTKCRFLLLPSHSYNTSLRVSLPPTLLAAYLISSNFIIKAPRSVLMASYSYK